MLKPYSAVPTNKRTHTNSHINKTTETVSELRRSASARLDGKSRESRGQTMRLCHLFVYINTLTVYDVS